MAPKPTIADAEARYLALTGQRFSDVVDAALLQRARQHKGGAGHVVEALLGVPMGPARLDFRDGELKTYHCDADGFPLETVAVCQVRDVDPYLQLPPFASTPVYTKLRRVLFVGVWRPDADPGTWRIPIAFRLDARPHTEWFGRIEASYQTVLKRLLHRFVSGETFATVNAPLLQMRVRDHRPYTPVMSKTLGRMVSNKGLGFYIQKRLLTERVIETRA